MCAQERNGSILHHCHAREVGGHFGATKTAANVLQSEFYWPTLFKAAYTHVKACGACQKIRNIFRRNEMPLNNILEVELFDVWGIDFMTPFHPCSPISTFWWWLIMFRNGYMLFYLPMMHVR